MIRRRVLMVAVSALLTAGVLCVMTPAYAGLPLPNAHADVVATFPSSTMFKVCAYGWNDDGGTGDWLFELDGLRGDGTQIHVEQTGFGASFSPPCYYISTNGTQDGAFVATLSFARIGSPIDTDTFQASAVPEFVALAGDEVEWTPQQAVAGFGM